MMQAVSSQSPAHRVMVNQTGAEGLRTGLVGVAAVGGAGLCGRDQSQWAGPVSVGGAGFSGRDQSQWAGPV